jgi:hypothetical protein
MVRQTDKMMRRQELPCEGYPAFVIGDAAIMSMKRKKVINKQERSKETE